MSHGADSERRGPGRDPRISRPRVKPLPDRPCASSGQTLLSVVSVHTGSTRALQVRYWGAAVSAVCGTGSELAYRCHSGVCTGTKKQTSGKQTQVVIHSSVLGTYCVWVLEYLENRPTPRAREDRVCRRRAMGGQTQSSTQWQGWPYGRENTWRGTVC